MSKELLDKIILFLGAQRSRLGVVSMVNQEHKPEFEVRKHGDAFQEVKLGK